MYGEKGAISPKKQLFGHGCDLGCSSMIKLRCLTYSLVSNIYAWVLLYTCVESLPFTSPWSRTIFSYMCIPEKSAFEKVDFLDTVQRYRLWIWIRNPWKSCKIMWATCRSRLFEHALAGLTTVPEDLLKKGLNSYRGPPSFLPPLPSSSKRYIMTDVAKMGSFAAESFIFK